MNNNISMSDWQFELDQLAEEYKNIHFLSKLQYEQIKYARSKGLEWKNIIKWWKETYKCIVPLSTLKSRYYNAIIYYEE